MGSNSPLAEYLSSDNGPFRWRPLGPGRYRFLAQEWHGISWEHDLALSDGKGDLAILVLTGGDPNDLDLAEQAMLARRTALPVATLFHVPNQPIEDRWEDDLVAYSFERFIETGDSSWPLLLPMVQSAVRAMDVLQDATDGRLKRYLITGLSKRGWTTWLTAAAGDRRIAGIAPMVIDALNFSAQMHHQLDTWGDYSPMIQDYTERGLPSMVDTAEGIALRKIVDPYEYLESIDVPTLIVNGANDPYWQVDALSLYWHDLRQPKWASIVPNAGHLLGDKVQQHAALCAFARCLAGRSEMPHGEIGVREQEGRLVIDGGSSQASVWMARSETLDFRESEWREFGPNNALLPRDRNVAAFAASRYEAEGEAFTLTSPAAVFRSRQ